MKKFNFSLLAGLLLLISASVCAENTPEKVQETFKKMYPKVTTVECIKVITTLPDSFQIATK